MTTILITGSNGFIGASFAGRARAQKWRVCGLDLQPQDAGGYCDVYRSVDLASPDAVEVLRALPPPDLILHAGGISGFDAACEGRPCHIPQARQSLRQYVYIEDVGHAIALAFDAVSPNSRVFNIAGDEIHTLEQVAAEVRGQVGGPEVSFDDSCDLPNYRVGKLCIDRARAELGYAPAFSLAAGIRSYWDAALAARQTLKPAAPRRTIHHGNDKEQT